MNLKQAQEILAWSDGNGNRNPLGARLSAHAVLWRNGSMPEHAAYCDEAASYIHQLEDELHRIKFGDVITVPSSREHAAHMILIAERYLKDNPASQQ